MGGVIRNTGVLMMLFCVSGATSVARAIDDNETFAHESSEISRSTVNEDTHRFDYQQFDLTEPDWKRYVYLMKGEAGVHYKHLDPVFVLGIYEENREERTRLARIKVKMDSARQLKLNRFIVEIATAGKDAYTELHHSLGVDSIQQSNEVVLFLKINSSKSEKVYKTLSLKQNSINFRLHLYFENDENTEALDKWLTENVDMDRHNNGLVTVNRDTFVSSQYQVARLPSAYINEDGVIREVLF